MVEKYDDKEFVNNLLRSKGGFNMPRGWSLSKSEDVNSRITSLNLPFPVVAKPIRGRGSYGVKVCRSEKELIDHVEVLFKDSPSIIMEEFLAGEEATVSVMPPSGEIPKYWAMPIVTRFNHADGIAPYNGTVAVTSNSRVVSRKEYAEDPAYDEAGQRCEEVAQLLRVTAPIRIDIRRFKNETGSSFALFDINMKPVSYSRTKSLLCLMAGLLVILWLTS
jgi:D-alanine-D-alanine ligase-like ATP-grasp enzyme